MFLSHRASQLSLKSILTRLEDVKNCLAFQINESTSESGTAAHTQKSSAQSMRRIWHILEVLAVFFLFAILTASITPGVNESHYLTKAKHFWNPDWCGNDIFLVSSDAHLFFFLTCGWPTLFLSLDTVAWIGRVLCWLFAAIAWVQLNRTIAVRQMYSIVSATMFVLLVERFNMAGEWVIGGFEAKSVAYIFVLWAINFFLRRRLDWCVALIGAAIAFHAVVGIWASVCFTGTIFFECFARGSIDCWRNSLERSKIGFGIAVFFVLAATGCVPPMLANWNTAPEIIADANSIQVQERLNHHLLFGSFKVLYVARFLLQVILFSLLFKFTQQIEKIFMTNLFCISSLLISLAGIFLSGLAEERGPFYDFANSLLRYYWFRFSDFTVPLSLSLAASFFAGHLMTSVSIQKRRMATFSLTCLGAAALLIIFESVGDWRSGADRLTLPTYPDNEKRTAQTFENWKKVCFWAKENTQPDSVFLTPFQFQTFKWYSNRAEFACWKDIPQDAENITAWRTRIQYLQLADSQLASWLSFPEEMLDEFLDANGITHVLLPQSYEDQLQIIIEESPSGSSPAGSLLRRVYPEEEARTTFVVFEVVDGLERDPNAPRRSSLPRGDGTKAGAINRNTEQ